MDTKKLRQKILDLAIHGKLVPQDPNDEPASVLLERIRAEKEQLIKEGKIKKSKASAKTSDMPHYEQVPFEVPEGWAWTTVGEVVNIINGRNQKDVENPQGQYPIYGSGGVIGRANEYLTPSGATIIGRKGTINNPIFVEENFWNVDTAFGMKPYYPLCDKYFFHYCQSVDFSKLDKSTAVPSLTKTNIGALPFPLPPLAEQQRIVAEIDKWFALIDIIEQGKDDLQATIAQAKSKILDLAIHGKLVPQDPSDEPAIELLRRINPKFTPCDNGHYAQLPQGWCMASIADLCNSFNGLWKGKKEPFVNVGVIRNANFTKEFTLDYSKIEYIDVELKQFEKRALQQGDLIVEKSGGSDNNPVGRAILFNGVEGRFSLSNFTMALRVKDKETVIPQYLYFVILNYYQHGTMRGMQTQTTGLHNLILDRYMALAIPVPPKNEQKRIINSILGLYAKMNTMTENL